MGTIRTIRPFVRWPLLAALTVLALGLQAPARAVAPLPDSCKTHPTKAVNPGCVPAVKEGVTEPGITLPNLVPDVREVFVLRPFVLDPETETFYEGEPHLFFDSWAQNLGTVPVQLTVDSVESPESSTVSQCVSWTARVCREQRRVGGFSWHDAHRHFHFNEFAAYELRRLGADGRPDYSASGLLATSEKVSFCLMDSQQVDPDAVPVPVYNACVPAVQGISPGWTDIYTSDLEGQQLPLTGLGDGRYSLIIKLNHARNVLESDYSDDVVEVTVEISNSLQDAQIVGRNYPAS